MYSQLLTIKKEFSSFVSRYTFFIYGLVPLYLITARFVGVVNFLWTLIFIPFFWIKNQRTTAILLGHLVSIVGDTRNEALGSIRPVRNMVMSLLFILTVWDIITKKYKFNTIFLYWLPFVLWASYGVTRSPILVDCALRTLSYTFMLFITLHAIPYEYKRTKGAFVTDWIQFMNIAFGIGLILLVIKPDWVIMDMKFVIEADDARYQGVYGNPNGLGVSATVLFPLLMLERFYLKKLSKAYSNFSFLLMTLSLLLSGSRSGLLSTILFSIFFFIENRTLFFRNLLKYFVIPSGFTFAYFFGIKIILMFPFLSKRLRITENMNFEEMTSGRGQVWNFLINAGRFSKISEWIWVGRGFSFDTHFFLALLTKYKGLPRQYSSPFSGIFSLTMNHGLIGLFLFMFTHIFVYRKMQMRAMALPMFVLLFFSSIFEGWITSSLNAFSFMYYATIAIALAPIDELKHWQAESLPS